MGGQQLQQQSQQAAGRLLGGCWPAVKDYQEAVGWEQIGSRIGAGCWEEVLGEAVGRLMGSCWEVAGRLLAGC